MSTPDSTWFDEAFGASRVMAILRGMGVERSVELSVRAWDLGIDHVELPVQTPDDLEALREVARLGAQRGTVVGAGTIVADDQLRPVLDAGARYVVAPGFDPALVRAAWDLGLPTLPGVATPSEVQAAQALGLTWLKAFPARWLGTDWFRLVKAPFPGIRFVATGGLDSRNARDFLDAGARVVAMGSALEDPAQLDALAELVASA